jgi:hypothetical protein
MAKTSGLAWTTFTVDDSGGSSNTDIRNDVTNFNFATPRAIQDVTGVDKSAYERLPLLADFNGTINGVFNASTSHGVFKTVSSTSVARTMALGVASQTLSNEVLLTDYQLTRGNDGALTWSVPFVLTGGTAPAWS